MSLVEHEKGYEVIEESIKKGFKPRCYLEFDSTDGIRFHLFIDPGLRKAYVTAYSLLIPTRYALIGTTKGFNPKVGLLFSDVEKRKLKKLSKKMEILAKKGKFNSNKIVSLLKKYLRLDERMLEQVISINKSKVLEKPYIS